GRDGCLLPASLLAEHIAGQVVADAGADGTAPALGGPGVMDGDMLLDNGAYGERETSLVRHPLARQRLRLFVAQDRDTIGIREIIGRTQRLVSVAIATCDAGEPLAGAALGLAVAEMQALLDSPVVGLATRFEPCSGGAGFQACISDSACHRLAPC